MPCLQPKLNTKNSPSHLPSNLTTNYFTLPRTSLLLYLLYFLSFILFIPPKYLHTAHADDILTLLPYSLRPIFEYFLTHPCTYLPSLIILVSESVLYSPLRYYFTQLQPNLSSLFIYRDTIRPSSRQRGGLTISPPHLTFPGNPSVDSRNRAELP